MGGIHCCTSPREKDDLSIEAKQSLITPAKAAKILSSKGSKRNPYQLDIDEKQLKLEERASFAVDADKSNNQINVYVIQACNLPKYDIGPTAKSDPYCKVQIGKKAPKKTRKMRRELNPIFNDHFIEEGVNLFQSVKTITIEVYDHDHTSKDDLMGYCEIKSLKALKTDYSSPVQWIHLIDQKGNTVKNSKGQESKIQVQITYVLHADDLNIRYYTHVMKLTIKKGKNLRSKELIGKSDPYCKVEWGTQTFKTKYVEGTDSPTWNQSVFIFVHETFEKKYQLKLSVMDKDIGRDDHLGTGYLPANNIFDQCLQNNKNNCKFDVTLRVVPVGSDRGLIEFERNEKFEAWGDLEIECELIPKMTIEAGFYKALVKTFDTNHDGVIDRDEVNNMFATLSIPQTDKLNANDLMKNYDENKDDRLDESEVIRMLQDSNFQGSELATQLIAIHLNGDLEGDFQKHLMTGFTQKSKSTAKVILIKDRETGLLVQEFVPGYVWYALKLTYNFKLNRAIIQSKIAHKILLDMSEKRGKKMDDPKSKSEIAPFIKQHNLDTNMLCKSVDAFATFNDFFARGIKVEQYRAVVDEWVEEQNVILSPADCRMMVFDSILQATGFWVKGKQFTLQNLLGKAVTDNAIDLRRYDGGSFAISRLAPQDYHRWHYPLSGTVKSITPIDGALYTVNPIAINKKINVYTDNKRCVIEIESDLDSIGRFVMIAVSAAMVGSYYLWRKDGDDPSCDSPVALKVGDRVERGDVAGEFRFGGSTVLLLFEPGKVKFDEDIVKNVNSKFETLVTVRSRIGEIRTGSS